MVLIYVNNSILILYKMFWVKYYLNTSHSTIWEDIHLCNLIPTIYVIFDIRVIFN